MLAEEVAGGMVVAVSKGQWIYVAHDRNINPAPARKLQRDRQKILLRDVRGYYL